MSDDDEFHRVTEIERVANGKPTHFAMDAAFRARMHAAIEAGLESAPIAYRGQGKAGQRGRRWRLCCFEQGSSTSPLTSQANSKLRCANQGDKEARTHYSR
jgi:hypothetical protein